MSLIYQSQVRDKKPISDMKMFPIYTLAERNNCNYLCNTIGCFFNEICQLIYQQYAAPDHPYA